MGTADDSAAIQSAIDQAAARGQGILLCPRGAIALRRPSMCGRPCESSAMAPRGRSSCWPITRPAIKRAWGICSLRRRTDGQQTKNRLGHRQGSRRRSRDGSAERRRARCESRHILFRMAMDIEIGQGKSGRRGHPLHVAQHCYLAAHGLPYRLGIAALKDIGTKARGPAFLWRPVWHP